MDKKNLYIGLGIIAAVAITVGASMQYGKRAERGEWKDKRATANAPKVVQPGIDLLAPEGAEPVADGTYTVLGSDSRMNWEGGRPLIPGYHDDGIVGISEGSLIVKDGKSTVGNIVINLNSIGVASTGKGRGESMLTNHLKSKDFFDVATYPTATFKVTGAEPVAGSTTSHAYTLKGDLTVKDKTNEVIMQGIAYTKDGLLHVVATTQLDRTKWDIRYGSDKFFDNLADQVIADTFTVTFDLVAKKQ